MSPRPDRTASRERCPVADGARLGFQMPPRLTVSQWSDAHRFIARGTGPEPGRWRTDRLPLLRQVMDAVNDPNIHTVVLKCSSQAAKTEVLINVAAFFIDQDAAPAMFVLPTLDLADSFSTKRFDPTVDATPALAARIGTHKSRDTSTTIREKSYPGGDLVFAGANSPASLASRPRRIVIFDEIDKYKANIGHDGDPIKQGIQRTQNFWNRRVLLASTPTLKKVSAIDDWFERSDQRHHYVPCKDCGEYQRLEWEISVDGVTQPRIAWTRGKPDSAHYVCRHCGSTWDQRDLMRAVRHGQWRPHAASRGIAGFHWWSVYTPWVTMAELAAEWEEAEGKPEKEQTFVNLKLGLSYDPSRTASTTPEMLMERREDYGPAGDGSYTVPEEVLAVSAFVDVQPDRFEVQYLGWGLNDEKWVLDLAKHWGDITDPKVWEALDDHLLKRMFRHPLSPEPLSIEAIGVDAGYMQHLAMSFVTSRRAAFRPIYAVKGVDGFGRPLWKESEAKFKLGAKLHISGVDEGKSRLYQELAVTEPRYRIHFPRHLDLDYFRQLVSEVIKVEYKAGRPHPSWHLPSGKRNEALDTFVGAVAVRQALSIDYEGRRSAISGTATTASYADLAQMF